MQWLQDQNQNDIDNLHNARREASEHYRKKIRNIWKLKFMKETSKFRYLYRGTPMNLRRVAVLELIL